MNSFNSTSLHPQSNQILSNESTLGEIACEIISNNDPVHRKRPFLSEVGPNPHSDSLPPDLSPLLFPVIKVPSVSPVYSSYSSVPFRSSHYNYNSISSYWYNPLDSLLSVFSTNINSINTLLKRYLIRMGVVYYWNIFISYITNNRLLKTSYESLLSLLNFSVIIPQIISDSYDGPIRGFSWHPFSNIFSVSLWNDTIQSYHLNDTTSSRNGQWDSLVLAGEFQKDLHLIAYSPIAGHFLAAAVNDGVCLWRIFAGSENSNLGVAKFSRSAFSSYSAWCGFLLIPSLHSNPNSYGRVTSMQFSSCGRYLAVCGQTYYSDNDNKPGKIDRNILWIWDVSLAISTEGNSGCLILENNKKTQFTLVKWSPEGSRLFVGTSASMFLIFSTENWEATKWKLDPCSNHSYCTCCSIEDAYWNNKGDTLLYIQREQSRVFMLNFTTMVSKIESITCPIDFGEESIIKKMAWSPNSQRLVLSIKGRTDQISLSLFSCSSGPIPTFNHIGFLQHTNGKNGKNISPVTLFFHPNFPSGDLVTVCWNNGDITHFPLFYKTISI